MKPTEMPLAAIVMRTLHDRVSRELIWRIAINVNATSLAPSGSSPRIVWSIAETASEGLKRITRNEEDRWYQVEHPTTSLFAAILLIKMMMRRPSSMDIARKLMPMEPLPEGALSTYKRPEEE